MSRDPVRQLAEATEVLHQKQMSSGNDWNTRNKKIRSKPDTMNIQISAQKIFRSSIFLFLVIFFALRPTLAAAQSGAGSIQGTVKDETGAVITDAQVHVVNLETHVATNTKSNHAGFYQVPELFTGRYQMTVTAPGMKTYETSVELLVAQNAVINLVMPAGALSQTVEVNADTIQLTTNDSAAIESTLENQRINQLPENGRELNTMVNAATPGVEGGTGGGNMTVNGGDPEAFEYIIDGARSKSNQNGSTPQSKVLVLDPDAVQEVRVVTSNASAQYSTPASAVTTTKSGTNHLHGTFFETARNNAFGVDRNREDPVGQKPPELIRNEFGLSAGGPVYIPKVYDGRNKTFWFFAYERYSIAQKTSSLINVPTAAMHNGDFSGLVNTAGQKQVIFDPATTVAANGPCAYLTQVNGKATNSTFCRTPFPNNTIGTDRESPLAVAYYQLMPLPTNGNNPLIKGNYTGEAPVYETVPQQTFRIDQTFNENNRAYLRYTHQHAAVNISDTPENNAIPGIPAGAAMGYNNNPSENFTAAIGYTHIFSPSFFLETIISQSWFNNAIITGAAPKVDYESLLNLPNNFGESGFPSIGALIQNLTSSQSGAAAQAQINSLLDENLTKVVGRHQILFGGRVQHVRQSAQPVGLADSVTFGKNSVALYDPTSKANYNPETNTGYPDAALFLGAAGAYIVNLEAPRVHYHEWRDAMYVQDNIHMRSNLTLNLGLRYEAYPALYTDNGLMNSFDLKNDAVVLAGNIPDLIAKKYTTQAIITNDEFIGMKFETPQEAGMPANTLLKNYNLNFLPRLGVAWTVSRYRWSPIIRGGYGIYLYDTPLENFANHPENNNPFTATYTRTYASAAQAVDGLPNELLRYNDPVMFGVAGLNTANVVDSASTTSILPGVTLWSDTPDWKPVRVQQGSVTVELPLPARSALRLSWIGSKTTGVDVSLSYNSTPTTFQWEAQTGTLPPTGGAAVLGTPRQNTYAAVATNPYDNTTYGESTYHTKDGWANYNSLQVNYQRLFHAGSAYQISYVYGKAMRAGGDSGGGNSDSTVLADADYPGVMGSSGIVSVLPTGGVTPFAGVAPPRRPANLPDWQAWPAMIKYQLYELDNSIPVHHIKFNGIYDIPVGRGKKYFSNTPRWLNEIVGGFQLAGNGSVVSQEFQPGSGNWGPTSPLHVYKKSHPVRDCSSGVCYNNFLWWNGYISPQLNPNDPNHDGSQTKTACEVTGTCISNIPASYVPFQTTSHNTPSDPNFNTDQVQVTLLNGTTATDAYDAGPLGANYTSKKFLPGPFNWEADFSIFKVFPITKGINLRMNLDAFNVFNVAGENNPGANGIQGFLHNYEPLDTARQLQITARLTF